MLPPRSLFGERACTEHALATLVLDSKLSFAGNVAYHGVDAPCTAIGGELDDRRLAAAR
ncbi:hypothetical protein [Pseudaminobacter sp. NGMCC 1.201702]|uniref:hypothetical protein n=1 Tax=Pseudaminobacter sp. NGMCC 1.201702 TaxID=3391825 RepID=UPI0039EE60E6